MTKNLSFASVAVWGVVGGALLAAGVMGCGAKPSDSGAGAVSAEGAKYILPSEPAESKQVGEVVAAAEDNAEVVIVGRIGGDVNPWVEGVAAFMLVDNSLVPCSERPGDTCKTPWDYCCDQNDLPKKSVTVKFVDAAGQPLAGDARKLFGLKELQTVIVRGKAQRGEKDALVVLAEGMYVKR